MSEPSGQSIGEVIRDRRTINFFKPDVPPREVVLEAIDLARWAPNHHLTEPWRFYLLSDAIKQQIVNLNANLVARAKGEEAGRAKRERWGRIPGWLVVTCVRSHDELRRKEDYAACCCAVHNLALYLWSRGIGMKWTTGAVTRTDAFYDLVWVDPVVEEVVGLFWYGYPDEVPVSVRKPVPEILVEL
ncbi:MAG: nitroreductase [Gammaproteobacteria bacterium]|nr:nitroreductase [Gammaproteobacteria bacterium]